MADARLTLRPYQEDAADFLFERDRAMVLAPVGAGKTLITLTAMNAMVTSGHARFWLVVAPLRVCQHVWPQEIRKWTGLSYIVVRGTAAERLAALQRAAMERIDVVIINYDNLQWLADSVEMSFNGVVFDELTRLKNPSGKRFKAMEKVAKSTPIRWGLTGSFTSNGLEDVFGQCKIIDQTLLGRSKGAFQQQYFFCINRDFGQWEPLPGSLEKVMQRIKPATYLLEPGEYADTLPPIHTVVMRCAMADRTPYETMRDKFVLELGGDRAAIAASAAVVTAKLQQLASGWVYDANRNATWFGSHKFDLLDDIIEENQHANTLIAYNFVEELSELKRRYPHARTIDQPNTVEEWNAGKIELLLIHPKSAGHGLNLQHGGCRIIWLSLPWSLELYEQTIGRLHRSGQQHDVWNYVLLTEMTVDERIWSSLGDKRTLSDIALGELQ